MKKLFFVLLALLCTASIASAQFKPEGLSFSTEVYYIPTAGGNTSTNQLSIPDYGVKVRAHVNKNWVARLNLGFNTVGDKATSILTSAGEKYKYFTKEGYTLFRIMPGAEYHFAKFERVSPYVGATIGLGLGSSMEKEWNSLNTDYELTTTPLTSFSIGAVAGVDVYLCKGLYAGVELGLGYDLTAAGKSKTKTSTNRNVETTKGTQTSLQSDFGFNVIPAIRLGWHF